MGESAGTDAEDVDFGEFTVVKSRKQLRQEKASKRSIAEEEAGREARHEAQLAPQPRASYPRSQPQPPARSGKQL